MRTKLEKQKTATAPSGPDGPSGQFPSSSHQRRHKVYRAFIVRYGPHAAVLLTVILAWFHSARKKGLSWCFQSFTKLAEQIPGLQESALRRQAKKLVAAGAIQMRAGVGNLDFSPSPQFKVLPDALRLIGEGENEYDASVDKTIRYFGADDAESFGIESALILANIEYHKSQYPSQPVGCRLSRLAHYLGLNVRTVQRLVATLLDKKALHETEVAYPRPCHRYFEFHPEFRRKLVFTVNQETKDESHPEETVEVPSATQTSPGDPAAEPHGAADTLGYCQSQQYDPTEYEDRAFRNLVQSNRENGEHPSQFEYSILRSWIKRADPQELLAIGKASPDQMMNLSTRYLELPRSFGGCELTVLAFQLRRHPDLPASSRQTRRMAYDLSLAITERLQENRQLRADMLRPRSDPRASNPSLRPSEKVEAVLAAIDLRNHVGVEGVVAPGFRCPNPPVFYDRFDAGGQGRAKAEKFFADNPDTPAMTIINYLDRCSQAPPKPTDASKKDNHFHSRAGIELHQLITKFTDITRELASKP